MEQLKVLIWGKTYPELSKKHIETVCTGGCLEDGSPIRLYPVPLRYLEDIQRYKLYDWIEVPVSFSRTDSRPESHRVTGPIKCLDHVSTKNNWAARRATIFKSSTWHYDCLNDLKDAQKKSQRSLGFFLVDRVKRVWIQPREPKELIEHRRKAEFIRRQKLLFGGDPEFLSIQSARIHVEWFCRANNSGSNACPGHTAGIYDWGLGELSRRKGMDAAKSKIESLTEVNKYELGFFVGNFKLHPHNFGVLALWYPKAKPLTLFESVDRNHPMQDV